MSASTLSLSKYFSLTSFYEGGKALRKVVEDKTSSLNASFKKAVHYACGDVSTKNLEKITTLAKGTLLLAVGGLLGCAMLGNQNPTLSSETTSKKNIPPERFPQGDLNLLPAPLDASLVVKPVEMQTPLENLQVALVPQPRLSLVDLDFTLSSQVKLPDFLNPFSLFQRKEEPASLTSLNQQTLIQSQLATESGPQLPQQAGAIKNNFKDVELESEAFFSQAAFQLKSAYDSMVTYAAQMPGVQFVQEHMEMLKVTVAAYLVFDRAYKLWRGNPRPLRQQAIILYNRPGGPGGFPSLLGIGPGGSVGSGTMVSQATAEAVMRLFEGRMDFQQLLQRYSIEQLQSLIARVLRAQVSNQQGETAPLALEDRDVSIAAQPGLQEVPSGAAVDVKARDTLARMFMNHLRRGGEALSSQMRAPGLSGRMSLWSKEEPPLTILDRPASEVLTQVAPVRVYNQVQIQDLLRQVRDGNALMPRSLREVLNRPNQALQKEPSQLVEEILPPGSPVLVRLDTPDLYRIQSNRLGAPSTTRARSRTGHLATRHEPTTARGPVDVRVMYYRDTGSRGDVFPLVLRERTLGTSPNMVVSLDSLPITDEQRGSLLNDVVRVRKIMPQRVFDFMRPDGKIESFSSHQLRSLIGREGTHEYKRCVGQLKGKVSGKAKARAAAPAKSAQVTVHTGVSRTGKLPFKTFEELMDRVVGYEHVQPRVAFDLVDGQGNVQTVAASEFGINKVDRGAGETFVKEMKQKCRKIRSGQYEKLSLAQKKYAEKHYPQKKRTSSGGGSNTLSPSTEGQSAAASTATPAPAPQGGGVPPNGVGPTRSADL